MKKGCNKLNHHQKQAQMVVTTAKAKVQEYVFGYGSLICPVSRTITAPTLAKKTVTPVIVKNVERIWAKNTYVGWTAMGVRFRDDAECVGVLLPVNKQELKQFDRREIGYDRVPLFLGDVELSASNATNKTTTCECTEGHDLFIQAKKQQQQQQSSTTTSTNASNASRVSIWMYLQQEIELPSPESPIVQSYVDTILRGCLSTGGEDFAKQFLLHTKGWTTNSDELLEDSSEDDQKESKEQDGKPAPAATTESDVHWVDDRHKPIYSRGDQHYMLQNQQKLDGLLKKYRGEEFRYRSTCSTKQEELSSKRTKTTTTTTTTKLIVR